MRSSAWRVQRAPNREDRDWGPRRRSRVPSIPGGVRIGQVQLHRGDDLAAAGEVEYPLGQLDVAKLASNLEQPPPLVSPIAQRDGVAQVRAELAVHRRIVALGQRLAGLLGDGPDVPFVGLLAVLVEHVLAGVGDGEDAGDEQGGQSDLPPGERAGAVAM